MLNPRSGRAFGAFASLFSTLLLLPGQSHAAACADAAAFDVAQTYFFAEADDDNNTGTELWASDGTATCMLKNIRPEADSADSESSNPGGFTRMQVGDRTLLFFAANDGTNGSELWVSDGTAAGTRMFTEAGINGGPASSFPQQFAVAGGRLYFVATAANGQELYYTDGVAAPTLIDINEGGPPSTPADLVAAGSTLYFTASAGDGKRVYRIQGEGAPEALAGDELPQNPGTLTVAGSGEDAPLYFGGDSRLWRFDGAEIAEVMEQPTELLTYEVPFGLAAVGSTIYFAAYDDASGFELWAADETGARQADNIRPDVASVASSLSGFAPAELGGALVFAANDGTTGPELWRYQAPGPKATQIEDIRKNSTTPSAISAFVKVSGGDRLFFSANDGEHGTELWSTDGTTAALVKDLVEGSGDSKPSKLSAVGGKLYFWTTEVFSRRSSDTTEYYTRRGLWVIDDPTADGGKPRQLLSLDDLTGKVSGSGGGGGGGALDPGLALLFAGLLLLRCNTLNSRRHSFILPALRKFN
ncbi:MAG: hypothetical protein HYV18_02245 [Gammaproteobacteria bacterium]|nr:hypothetical protein [Gammaproteobacteria bacterium]